MLLVADPGIHPRGSYFVKLFQKLHEILIILTTMARVGGCVSDAPPLRSPNGYE